MNLGSNISYSILLVFLVRELGLKPEAIGIAFSIGSIGVLAGAASAAAFGRRLGVGPALIVATAIVTGGAFLILLATPDTAFVLLLITAAVQGFSGIIINVNGVSLRQSLTPDHLQGRVNATGRWINWSILPLASILGGLIATAIGLRGTILVGAVIGLASLPWLIFTPIRKLREMPRSPIGVPAPEIDVLPGGQPPA
jgi:MFS family permease